MFLLVWQALNVVPVIYLIFFLSVRPALQLRAFSTFVLRKTGVRTLWLKLTSECRGSPVNKNEFLTWFTPYTSESAPFCLSGPPRSHKIKKVLKKWRFIKRPPI